MKKSPSLIDEDRKNGVHQLDEQRNAILKAAETLFLQNGLDQTTMVDIARHAGIHKVTLYRYFPTRGPIAFEIAARMLKRITSISSVPGQATSLESLKGLAHSMIVHFNELRDAYRYIGMFDHIYNTHYPDEQLAQWYKQEIFGLEFNGVRFEEIVRTFPQGGEVVMMLNTIMSFLEKMAARGELMSGEQEVPLQRQLDLFSEMVGLYFDHLIQTQTEE